MGNLFSSRLIGNLFNSRFAGDLLSGGLQKGANRRPILQSFVPSGRFRSDLFRLEEGLQFIPGVGSQSLIVNVKEVVHGLSHGKR
jgi:hypothetical protein